MRIIATTLAIVLVAASLGWAHDGEPTTFTAAWTHYAAIQQALANDTLDGVSDHARALRDLARAAAADFDPGHAGVAGKQAAACKALLPRLADSAVELAGAGSLEAARAAFVSLSEEMIAFRDMVPGERPQVAYCPMAKHYWLQDGGQIANPYYGKKMSRCGSFVDDDARPGRTPKKQMQGHMSHEKMQMQGSASQGKTCCSGH